MKRIFIFSLLVCGIIGISASTASLNDLDYVEAQFIAERKKFLKTGVKSDIYNEIVEKYRIKSTKNNLRNDPFNLRVEDEECFRCRLIAGIVLDFVRTPEITPDILRDESINMCLTFEKLTENLCTKAVNLNFATIHYILKNLPNITSNTLCGVLYQQGLCEFDDPIFNFTINVSPGGAPITKSKERSPGAGENKLKIIHLSDIHYDPKYFPGALADCDDPLCCRLNQGYVFGEKAAGAWGDYRNCDSPWRTVRNMLEHIGKEHSDANLVYFTGDVVDHGIWETTVQGNKEAMRRVYREMSRRLKSIPIFPVLGNHDTNPANIFAPSYINQSDISTHWLYEFQTDAWKQLLPENVINSIQEDGYYTALARPGLRIISLNNNIGQVYNFWMLYDPTYMTRQLQWLNDVLLLAEQEKEKVHLLYHIPNGESTCYKVWAREFRRIVERFRDTISAQFNGHTHFADFNVFYGIDDPQYAINSAFNGGSTTTYPNVNPNYNIYEVDDVNFEVSRAYNYYFNLTEANQRPLENPKWQLLYDTEALNLTNLSPAGLNDLVERLANNQTELQMYFEYNVKKADALLADGCNQECFVAHLCKMVTTEIGDDTKCNAITEKFLITSISSTSSSLSTSSLPPTSPSDV